MKTTKIAILGFGTVGSGVYTVLQQNSELIRHRQLLDLSVKRVLVRDLLHGRNLALAPMETFTTDYADILADGEISIVVECIGGVNPAKDYILRALQAGKTVVTANKEIPANALMDMKIALITLKYTQSNSVCYVKDGQAIGIGAGQQSRVHCTRLAGNKADNWFLRQAPQVLNLPFLDTLGRAERDNAIDVYIGEEYMDVLADGAWENIFKEKPEVFTREAKRAWLDQLQDVTLGSDAFFPFPDNIERARKSGVKYIAQPGGSVRDDQVIACCDKYGMAMAFTGIRLFHH